MKCSSCKKQIKEGIPLVGDVGIHYFCDTNCFNKWKINLLKGEKINNANIKKEIRKTVQQYDQLSIGL